jgi:hypothetical protein
MKATKGRKAKRSNGGRPKATEYYDVLQHRTGGKKFVVYLCRRCARGWRYEDPVPAWKVNNVLKHAASHIVDASVSGFLKAAGVDPMEGLQ